MPNNEKELELIELMSDLEKTLCDRLHISKDVLSDIVKDKRHVSHIVFSSKNTTDTGAIKRRKTITRRIAILATVFMLFVCIFVEGFADGVREKFLSIVLGRQSIQIQTIAYTNEAALRGAVLPDRLPDGYRYHTFTKSSGAGMLYVEYTNPAGNYIRYYYYPGSITASYDVEQSVIREVRHNGEVVRIVQDKSGKTVALFPFEASANIQIEFDEPVTDQTIMAVIDSIQPQF